MDDAEPLMLVQEAPAGQESAAPLVLIHDGGGTTVSYFYLELLDRAVYAIQNPRFYSGKPWEGGLPEMGRLYTQMIKAEIARGPILLGGWSLGGVLSLEVAHNLSQSSDIQVLGVIMIDSIFPQAFSKHDARVAPSEPIFASETGAEMRRRVSRSFEMAVAMVNGWVPPVWKGCSDPDTYARRAKVEADLTARLGARNGIQQDARRNLATECSMTIDDLPSPPRTVLLRCSEHVPVSQPNTISRVDVTREREKLGWEDYGYDLISAVIGVPGNHFNLFGEGNLEEISSRIKLACRKLERGDC